MEANNRNTIKKTGLLIIFGFIFQFVTAQEIPFYNDYLHNMHLLNPAEIGKDRCNSFYMTNKYQWAGLKGAPYTQTANLNFNIPKKKKIHAVGIFLMNDRNGDFRNLGVKLSYAQHIMLIKRKGIRMSFGISAFAHQYFFDLSSIPSETFDPAALSASAAYVPNADAGIRIYNSKFYSGIAATYLIPVEYSGATFQQASYQRHYFVYGGYRFSNKYSALVYEPLLVYRMKEDFTKQIDVSCKVSYKKYFANISYRRHLDSDMSFGKNLITAFGMKIRNFSWTYAFDASLSALQKHHFGSHQIALSYMFCLKSNEKSAIPCP